MLDEKETTVYKRALDVEYKLKLKASRVVFSEINKRFPAMPFTIRALTEGAEGEAKQDLTGAQLRLGLVECLKHDLLHPYPVLHEKQGDLVAQVSLNQRMGKTSEHYPLHVTSTTHCCTEAPTDASSPSEAPPLCTAGMLKFDRLHLSS